MALTFTGVTGHNSKQGLTPSVKSFQLKAVSALGKIKEDQGQTDRM